MYHTAADVCVRARSRFFSFFLHPHLLLLHVRSFCVYLNERENASFSLGGHFLRINVILYTHVLFSFVFFYILTRVVGAREQHVTAQSATSPLRHIFIINSVSCDNYTNSVYNVGKTDWVNVYVCFFLIWLIKLN